VNDPLAGLLRSLQQAGLDVDTEAALDATWLALQIRRTTRAAEQESSGVVGPGAGAQSGAQRGSLGVPAQPVDIAPPLAEQIARAADSRRADRSSASVNARALTLARASALPDRRDLIRALRPLRRRVASPGSGVVDIDATVRRAAEEDLWLPSFAPTRERWLDMLLVVDHGLSMILWKDTVDEFERVLRNSGAFRSVRAWWLESDDVEIGVRARGRGQSPASPETLARLARGTSRSTILVVSDCVGARWHDGVIPRLMATWSQDVPLALVQVTPEWFWARTALGDAVESSFRSVAPATINRRMRWDATALAALGVSRERADELLRVPATTLAPRAMARVAELIAGVGRDWTPGVVFDLTWDGGAVAESAGTTDSQRATRFAALASKDAQRLAAAFAASPVLALDVLRLLRRDLLPHATPFTEAEVLLGGIVRVRRDEARWDDGASLPLEFFPGVQSTLLDGAIAGDVLRVLTHAASMAASGIGDTFTSWLAEPSKSAAKLDPNDNPFAAAAAEALLRLGGRYARIVKPPVNDDAVVRMEFILDGRVAGVGLRAFVEGVARDLGIRGNVRNLADGTTSVVADGPRSVLEKFGEKLAAGPPGARIERVERRQVAAEPQEPAPASQSTAETAASTDESLPIWELRFDEHGAVEGAGVSSVAAAVHSAGVTDLIVIVHGWNVDRPAAHAEYREFFDNVGRNRRFVGTEDVRFAGLGVVWPSQRWPDEDAADEEESADSVEASSAVEADEPDVSDADRDRLERAKRALEENVHDPQAVARLDEVMHDLDASEAPGTVPQGGERRSGFFGSIWQGAKNLLRTATYYQMRNRAAEIGRAGLGPFLGQLATVEPTVRVHLVAHSIGARLATRALAAMMEDYASTPTIVKSLTLLQGIMSSSAFAPGASPSGASLGDALQLVDGPVVVTYSRNDKAASTVFPLLSRAAGKDDDAPNSDAEPRALGAEGAQHVRAPKVDLLRVGRPYRFGPRGIYNVDGTRSIGGHSDVFGPEIAWLVLSATRRGAGLGTANWDREAPAPPAR
jgi:acylphosphatase